MVNFPGITEVIAYKVVSRIQRAIIQHDWRRIAAGLKMTASFGIASHESGDSLESWLKKADDAVYVSKKEGRNTVSAHSQLKK